jgi:hypothetical protein
MRAYLPELIGGAAAAPSLYAAYSKTIITLRVAAIVANVLAMMYCYSHGAYPTFALNALLLENCSDNRGHLSTPASPAIPILDGGALSHSKKNPAEAGISFAMKGSLPGLTIVPGIDLLLRLILGVTVSLLDLAFELVTLARDHVQVVVGELTPLLFDLALHLLPISFNAVPVHEYTSTMFAGSQIACTIAQRDNA